MYDYLTGEITDISLYTATLERDGAGHLFYISSNTAAKLRIGEKSKLFVRLVIRDEEVTLFGFHSKEERAMFLKLTSISGIGPKTAIAVLSGIELSSLALAIITEDKKAIAKIKGVGKKTAERIILELKEKMSAEEAELAAESASIPQTLDKDAGDAVAALRSLGIPQGEALRAVERARPMSTNIEELILNSLKNLRYGE